MGRKLPAFTAILLLLGVVSALFFPALFQGKILAPLDITETLLAPWSSSAQKAKPYNHNPSDAVTQYLPYRIFAEKSFKEDGYIGWNPYEMGGYNLAANTMAVPASWTMQLHRFLPFYQAWNLGLYLEFLTAGLGMLVFLRGRKLDWISCLLGALCFTLNAQFITWIYHRWALSSFCWMPWLLWAGLDWKGLQDRTPKRFLIPVFIAISILGASLQHMAFIFLTCACMVFGQWRSLRDMTQSGRVIFGWACVWTIALGMTAFSVIPQIEAFLINNSIGFARGHLGYASGISQPFYHALQIPLRFWPWLVGTPQSIDGFRAFKASFMSLNFIGSIPMCLSIIALFYANMPRTAKWLVCIGLLIPLTPLVGPFYHRVELLFILGGAWLTAECLTRFSSSFKIGKTWQLCVYIGIFTLGMLLLVSTCLPEQIRGLIEQKAINAALTNSHTSQFGADSDWIASRAKEWANRLSFHHAQTAWVYSLLALSGLGLYLTQCTRRRMIPCGKILILTATTLELGTLFQLWCTFSNPQHLLRPHVAIESLQSLAGPYRVHQLSPNTSFSGAFATPNLLASYGIKTLDAYESIQYRSTAIALRKASPQASLSLAGVKYTIHPCDALPTPGSEAWPILSHPITGFTIRENPNSIAPIVWGKENLPATIDEMQNRLPLSGALTPTLETMNRKIISIPEQAAWLRISENWHPGWKWKNTKGQWTAFTQGADAACWISNLQDAPNRLEVQFFPRPLWLVWVSLGSVMLWAGLLVFMFPLFPKRL